MEDFLRLIKKIVPYSLYRAAEGPYHFFLAALGALLYGFPSGKLFVIGVTGTKGKTTTCNLIAEILNEAGLKTGLATTVNFRVGGQEWINETKQTMLGRFQLQKLLHQMAKNGCKYAVIETSSEGILQYRHRFINYKIGVFTNLTPEHIERHGGFENYRKAKLKLFEKIAEQPDGVGVYNLDDPSVSYFLEPNIKTKYGITKGQGTKNIDYGFRIKNIKLFPNKTELDFNNERFEIPLIGEFNVYNTGLAICVGLSQNIPLSTIKSILKRVKSVPGRMELISKGQNFTIIIDYAHEPASLEAVYKTIRGVLVNSQKSKVICLFGGQGGGRDKWKRSAMGEIAARYCDRIILTNEDPYDENPNQILSDIKSGISNSRFPISNLYQIRDRREAIKKAISLAKTGDVVILTGKGGEVWMCLENNKKIPWDERAIAENLLQELLLR